MRLHDYWRSTASYRVRIGLHIKGLAFEHETHDLRRGEQAEPRYAALNPQKLVPALEVGGAVLVQSMAILEWLEEAHPRPPLLPQAPIDRAIVRAMAGMVASDIHPINNLRVLNALRSDVGADPAQVAQWIARWTSAGLEALERLVEQHGGAFAFGDKPTFADCCLVPQLYSAERFAVSLAAYPRLVAAGEVARALPAFAAAHPSRQPGADLA